MGARGVNVAVVLARRPGELGEWLADAAAFEAAGADALWWDPAREAALDPLTMLAALAALTSRSLLVAGVSAVDRPQETLARTLDTIGRLSHGHLPQPRDRRADVPRVRPLSPTSHLAKRR